MQKKKNSHIYLISLWRSQARICAAAMFFGMCNVLKDLDKIY